MTIQEKFSIKTHKDAEKSHARIDGVIPKDDIEAARKTILGRLGKEKKIDGFRDGHAPTEIIEREVGSLEIWRQSAQEVITKNFAEIIAEEKIVPLGHPQMQITSIADRSDVSFYIQFHILPEVSLPEYKTFIKNMEKPEEPKEATNNEVQQVVIDIRKGIYKKAHPEKDLPSDENNLPELTDTYIQEVSQQYRDVESFLQGVRESITKEKALQARALFRQKILDTIAEKTAINIPEIMIEEESKRAYEDLKAQAEHFNTTIEEYLKAQKITKEKLWEQLKNDAKKRAKMQLIMNTISIQEHIHANKKEVEKEVERFKKRETGMNENQLYTYVETLLTNEAVIQSLEKIVTEQEENPKQQQ